MIRSRAPMAAAFRGPLREEAPAGIALILVSGLLVMLTLAAALFLQVASTLTPATAAQTAAWHAERTAGSGLAYATARLTREERHPRSPKTIENRGDDWSFRDEAGGTVAAADNPSFSHGEAWRDVSGPGEKTGVYQRGFDDVSPQDAWIDLDGDGRFSAWSGRLRGGPRTPGSCFSLKIAAADGKIPLNAGALWAENRVGSALPDHKDLYIAYHAGLAKILDNLGALLAIGRSWSVPAGASLQGEPFLFSTLGQDLIGNRPAGGYQDWTAVETTLLSLTFPDGQPGYAPADIAAIRPFLDLGPYTASTAYGRRPPVDNAADHATFVPYVPISLVTAPTEVLQSIWLYAAIKEMKDRIANEPQGWDAPCTRTGPANDSATLSFGELYSNPANYIVLRIFPDEAARLAARVETLREAGPFGWNQLYADFLATSDWIFEKDISDINAINEAPDLTRGWKMAKAHLAFRVAAIDQVSLIAGSMGAGLLAHHNWGADRDAESANGVQPFFLTGLQDAFGHHSAPLWSQATGWYWPNALSPYRNATGSAATQGGSLAPPLWFDVTCAVRNGGAATSVRTGRLLAAERLDWTCQEDFEHFAGSATAMLARRGVTVVDDPTPATRRDTREDDVSGRTYPHITILPRWNPRAAVALPAARSSGGVTLSTRETGSLDALFYWPFSDDFDPGNVDFMDASGQFAFQEVNRYLPFHIGQTELRPEPLWAPPNLTGDLGVAAGPLTIEFWGAGGAAVRLYEIMDTDGFANDIQINVNVMLDHPNPALRGIHCTVKIAWVNVPGISLVVSSSTFFMHASQLPDPWIPFDRESDWRHFVFVFEPVPGGALSPHTRLRAYLNGKDMGEPSPAHHGDLMGRVGPDALKLKINHADEIRFYGSILQQIDVLEHYLMDRFVRKAFYTSPLYRFDAPTVLEKVQWTGVVPHALYEASDVAYPASSAPILDAKGLPVAIPPETILRAELVAYADPDGRVEAFPPQPLAESGVVYDLPAQAVRAFRYRVLFDCERAAGPLDETPVFESLWLTYKRAGRTGSWTE